MAVRTKAALETQLTTLLADNTAGDISAGDVRSVLQDILDSLIFPADLQAEIDDVTGSDSWRTAGGVSVQDVLDEIMGGTQVTIDRSTDGQIIINYTASTPAVTHENYAGVAVSATPTAAEFTESGTTVDLELANALWPAGTSRYLVYAKPEAQGAFSYAYYYPSGNRNTQNVLGTSFETGTGTITLGGEAHLWIRSRAAFPRPSGDRVIEAA